MPVNACCVHPVNLCYAVVFQHSKRLTLKSPIFRGFRGVCYTAILLYYNFKISTDRF